MNATVLRELGAETRTFRSLAHVLVWWRQQRRARGLQAMPLEVGSAPRAREVRDESLATFAAITTCLGRHHEVDLEGWPLSEWRVSALAHWLASDDVGRVYMAERLGWSEVVAQRFMDETSSVLRRRMRERGLIP